MRGGHGNAIAVLIKTRMVMRAGTERYTRKIRCEDSKIRKTILLLGKNILFICSTQKKAIPLRRFLKGTCEIIKKKLR